MIKTQKISLLLFISITVNSADMKALFSQPTEVAQLLQTIQRGIGQESASKSLLN